MTEKSKINKVVILAVDIKEIRFKNILLIMSEKKSYK
jgi:hypothetical protein